MLPILLAAEIWSESLWKLVGKAESFRFSIIRCSIGTMKIMSKIFPVTLTIYRTAWKFFAEIMGKSEDSGLTECGINRERTGRKDVYMNAFVNFSRKQ